MTSSLDQTNFDFLLANARVGKALGQSNFLHLDQPIGLWNYIRIANEIAAFLPKGAHVLDWGCGMGQMSYLLKQRGLRVTSYDVGPLGKALPNMPLSQEIQVIFSQEPTVLPFEVAQFDAVLSCGVLEHIDELSTPGNEMLSLREIHRVLRPAGHLLIYQLPQQRAWQEVIIRHYKLGYAHPRRYTDNEIKLMLHETGFTTQKIKRANLIPKNLTGLPEKLRKLYSKAAHLFIALDKFFAQLPGLRNIAGVLEVIASKTSS